MADKPKSLEEMIKELPPDLYQTALDYIQFLYEKRVRKPKGKMKRNRREGPSDSPDNDTPKESEQAIRGMWDDDISSPAE